MSISHSQATAHFVTARGVTDYVQLSKRTWVTLSLQDGEKPWVIQYWFHDTDAGKHVITKTFRLVDHTSGLGLFTHIALREVEDYQPSRTPAKETAHVRMPDVQRAPRRRFGWRLTGRRLAGAV